MKVLKLTPQERGLKEEIKQFMQDNLFNNKLDTRPYRKIWWDNNKPEYGDFIFDNYEKYNKIFPMKVKDFIEFFFFDREGIFYETFEEFFNKVDPIRLTNILGIGRPKPANGPLLKYVQTGLSYFENQLNFKTNNMSELKYCIDNNIKERPKCKSSTCNNKVNFSKSYTNGFRDYCSHKCQMYENNRIKESRKSELSDDEIRKIIDKVPLDLRNMTKVEIADNIGNINEYVDKIQTNLPVKERIYIFMNKLTIDDIICPICKTNFKQFYTQGVGYRSTCKNEKCRKAFGKASSLLDSGYLYVLYSKEEDIFKIVISLNTNKRLIGLRRSLKDLDIVYCFYLDEKLTETERMLHEKFMHKHSYPSIKFDGHTEFFKLDKNDLKFINNTVLDLKYGNS